MDKITCNNTVYSVLDEIKLNNHTFVIVINNPTIEYFEKKEKEYVKTKNEILDRTIEQLNNNIKSGKYKVIRNLKEDLRNVISDNIDVKPSLTIEEIREYLNFGLNKYKESYLQALLSCKIEKEIDKPITIKPKEKISTSSVIAGIAIVLLASFYSAIMFIIIIS